MNRRKNLFLMTVKGKCACPVGGPTVAEDYDIETFFIMGHQTFSVNYKTCSTSGVEKACELKSALG